MMKHMKWWNDKKQNFFNISVILKHLKKATNKSMENFYGNRFSEEIIKNPYC